jgi:hypothetical protein
VSVAQRIDLLVTAAFSFQVLVPWGALNSRNFQALEKIRDLAQLSDSSTGYHGYIDAQV